MRSTASWVRTALVALGLVHFGCAHPALDRARAQLYLSRLRLQTQPSFAIEGDEVMAWVPIDTRPSCPFSPEIVREERFISIRLKDERSCPISTESGSSQVGFSLGILPAGDYVLRAGAFEHVFTVLPPNTPVGPVPVQWQVAIAVEQKFGVAYCSEEGGYVPSSPSLERIRRRHPLLFRQMHVTYPDMGDDETTELLGIADYIDVFRTGDQDFKYTIQEFLCCPKGSAGMAAPTSRRLAASI